MRYQIKQDFETPLLPCGHTLQMVVTSTWGDKNYAGLCGLELYDAAGVRVPTSTRHLSARPSSINDLPEIDGDPRTLDKLVDGQSNTWEPAHMWLVPWTPGKQVLHSKHPVPNANSAPALFPWTLCECICLHIRVHMPGQCKARTTCKGVFYHFRTGYGNVAASSPSCC